MMQKSIKNHKKRNLAFFLIGAALGGIILGVIYFISQNYQSLLYPLPHTDQPSPKKYVEKKSQPNPSIKPEVIEHGDRNKHQVALTFDADMTPGMLLLLKQGKVKSWYNSQVKEILDREQVRATIFLGGLWAKTYPKEAFDLAHDPLFEIGNHSFGHPAFAAHCFNLPVLDNSQDVNEVESAQKIITEVTGVTPKYFRFPGGCYEKIDVETITKLGLKIIHWDVAADDGFNKHPDLIINKVLLNVKNGSIVVFHIHGGPYAPKTHEAVQVIIPKLKKQGYQFVTISEMLGQ